MLKNRKTFEIHSKFNHEDLRLSSKTMAEMAVRLTQSRTGICSTRHFPCGLEPLQVGFESLGPLLVPLSISPACNVNCGRHTRLQGRAKQREGEVR